MSRPFVHLRVHTEFSLADGIVRTDDLVKTAVRHGMPAVAVTDLANLFGVVKFYQAACAAGVKPLIGADVWLENPADPHKPHRLVLLCQNTEGYRRLCRLLTRAYVEGQHSGRPCLAKSWLEAPMSGLIALSGAHEGDIGQALLSGNVAHADELAHAWQQWFPGCFYLELQRTGQPFQEDYNHAAVDLARRLSLPVVATNHVVFLQPDDFDAHEVRVCIQDGRVLTDTRRPRRYTPQQYFRSSEEMAELFQDIPEALDNTVEIARRCNLHLELGKYYLPAYPVPEGMTIDQLLRRDSEQGLEARLNLMPVETREAKRKLYTERLELELATIVKMGFPGYFLIVADFIQWAKQNGIPVGPGRGSGAGSLVAWSLGITELDPIKYDLLFERFLNPERVSLPDFDVDFCIEGRDRVIEYVNHKYGQDKVAQIITHGTMAAKAVVRDVGRVMDHPYGYVDKLAKLIPFEIGMTLERALEIEPQLAERYQKEDDVRDLLDTARVLEGLARSAGKHAAGVVIAPGPLTDYMPLYCEQGSTQTVTQFDMGDVEAIGLVKFDFLGLRNLTIIDKALKTINAGRAEKGEPPVVIEQLPIDDPATYALIKSARTTALFQLESRGMKDLIQRLQPDNFEEIVALVALFRPGPLQSGMVDDFINRKHKRTAIKYLHPSLEPILKPTYGVILYQEQVMQIAQVLSGYTLGGADLLRRAMGKKKPEEMAQQREGFVQGAVARSVSDKLATHIFDVIEKFAGYGFNRSHSAAYALIAYQTAWLKAHYPAAFMAAVLSSDMDKTDKVVTMMAECRDMKLNILPPDINRCEYHFVPVDDGTILYGLGAIKGLGAAAIEAILQERHREGPFRDLFDFCQRIDLRKVNRRVLESLIKAGALDGLGTHRAALMASLNAALAAADQHSRNLEAGQSDIFGATAAAPTEAHVYETVAEWSEEQRLDGERDTLGLYLTGHPIARYAEELKAITDATIAEIKPSSDSTLVVAGLVVAQRTMQTRRGDRMAFVTLDDRTGRLELAVFSDLYAQSRELLAKDTLLVVEGQVSVDEYTGGFKMSAEKLYNIDQARAAFSARLVIDVNAEQAGNGFVEELKEILRPAAQGKCPVYLHYRSPQAEAEIVLGDEWRISPTNNVLERLSRLAGESSVHLIYR
ncbi:DNA polymerase III subunit alpha [Sulfuricaulis limicola]|uniref:DNA polymerase III subunit alpha n=1 Tax=Sulfuricaulis limicola TaxID=1620215 RepID=A0A1B4XGG3_9GAMM|nr:DNA polymerase III subunit alpha [Sulfuricaulis limicola]BAV33857.1 DNA polymerase III subunit alpha [Sulfuricaulis limicola]